MPRATKRAIEEFIKSAVWDDIRQLLSDRLMLVRNDLEENSPYEEVQRLRGEAGAIRFMLGLPDRLVSEYDNLMKEEEVWQKGQGLQGQEQEQVK